MEKEFVDSKGNEVKIVIEDSNNAPANLDPSETYKLVNAPKKIRKKVVDLDVGPGSNGFAQIATLASIIAIGGIIVAFILFRL